MGWITEVLPKAIGQSACPGRTKGKMRALRIRSRNGQLSPINPTDTVPTTPRRARERDPRPAMDAVQAANSGHPGMPMGMADIAEVALERFLKHNPAEPCLGRSRPLRAVERSRLDAAVSLLHLTGYDCRSRNCATFRQLGSKTAGHPETAIRPGVETTTGPLGQGIANAVGMALAEKVLAASSTGPATTSSITTPTSSSATAA